MLPPSPTPLLLLSFLLLLLLLLGCPGSSAAGGGVTARTLSPCYAAALGPASGQLVSAAGCTVLLTAPRLNASRVVAWEYKTGWEEGAVVSYAFGRPANTSRPYKNRTRFNETDFSLRIALRRGDGRLYRFRSESEATGWFQLRVVEPLSEPEIVGNSSVKAGGSTKLVCNVLEGKADSYRWKKNGELLLGSDHIRFVDNSTLCIVKATMNDSGYYACEVRNEVSQNETSFLLHVQNAANVVLPVALACVVVGSLAGVFVWCRSRDRPCLGGCRWRA
ncbi:junctional adhesion molecule A-like [Opisthocomus hoazin]|uniref:junctional adhesion molecule A-like n=1 Tax=Opisthocomus hoazin TaxID=30419 RepID=UPI003F52EE08